MEAHALRTRLVKQGDSIEDVIVESISSLQEQSVLIIASKIFSYAEQRLIPKVTGTREEKHEWAKKEAEYWINPRTSQFNMMVTVKDNWLSMNAGIDESNADHMYALWPKDPQASVNRIWQFLRSQYGIREVGVIMSDSRSFPLNRGVVGHGITHCGFEVLKSYVGQTDLHGREMKMEQVNMMQNMVCAGVLEMGEGNEQTPMAMVTGVKDLVFQDREPSDAELAALRVSIADDAYEPILSKADWQAGLNGNY